LVGFGLEIFWPSGLGLGLEHVVSCASGNCDDGTVLPDTHNSAVTATELLQLLDLACGTLFRYSCEILTSPTDCSLEDWQQLTGHLFRKHEHATALCDFDMPRLRKTLTYLLTYLLIYLLHLTSEMC